MTRRFAKAFWIALGIATSSALGQTIIWSCDANSINQSSNDQVMDSRFRFELGVFTGSFVPTGANVAEWAANWKSAQRITYDSVNRRYAGSFTPLDNSSPFVAGKPTYVWGFSGDAIAGEWILFRSSSWLWPEANPPVPPSANTYEWFAKNATAVVGVGMIHTSGSPFLLKSSAVFNVAPPSTTFTQWQVESLAGEPLNAPKDDPDQDGSSNLLEFVFGTSPLLPNPPALTPVERVGDYLQIRIPRRIDHLSLLTIERSDDLVNWYSGVNVTENVSEGLLSQVVRDLTPLVPLHATRFMRLKAEILAP